MSRSRFVKLGLAALLVPLAGGCAPAPAPVSISRRDPSSPKAPEGADPMTKIATATPPAPANDHAHHEHAEPAADAVVYACPMHPEVTSTRPGQVCPKCNMKLVPKS